VCAQDSPSTVAAVDRPQTLDLRAPDVTVLLTETEIWAALVRSIDRELERIEVEAQRIDDAPFTDRSGGNVELVFREVLSWLAPYPAALVANVNATPDATDSYRPTPAMMGLYHASFAPPASQR